MAILGIVAEYDPFHMGHYRHLRESISAVNPSAVIVALSGVFKQRGEPAMLSPFLRAECAVSAGADAVVALPVLWTVRDAEHYALGAVSLLSALGATHLSFGAETADLALLSRTAELLDDPPSLFTETLRLLLSGGMGYPAAIAKAAGKCIPESECLLGSSNNILAVCYLRAIRRLHSPLTPIVIPRSGSYRDELISPESPSASAVRDALYRGSWDSSLSALPPFSADAVRSAFLNAETTDPRRYDALLLDRLRTMDAGSFSGLPDSTEGLDAALMNASSRATSRNELISLLTSRRYSAARINRLCTFALLGVTESRLKNEPLPNHVLLLAIKKNPYLTGSWKNSSVRVASPAKWAGEASAADLAAFRLWGLCSGHSGSFPFSQHIPSR